MRRELHGAEREEHERRQLEEKLLEQQVRELVRRARETQDPLEQERLYTEAHRLDLNDPMALGGYGMVLALRKQRYQEGIVFCEEALRRKGPHPELLLNLGRALIAASCRRDAVRVLRRALARAPGHPRIIAELAALGLRARPVIPFLPRSFFLNRWLGRLRHWLRRRPGEEDPRAPLALELGFSPEPRPRDDQSRE